MSDMPKGKRAADPDTETTEENKRFRSAIDDAASDLLCPITQELPLDPVMGEDGHVYERDAIADWLTRKQKSPLTNEPMGRKLVAAHGVKNTIRKLVASGAISGGKAEAWQQRLQDEAKVAELRSKAEAGDAQAMASLGNAYCCGEYGLQKDLEKAHEWLQRADHDGHAGGRVAGIGILADAAIKESSLARRFEVGDQCWARDVRNQWCHATVCACVGGNVKVHYTGWSKQWDEWKQLDVMPSQVKEYVLPTAAPAPQPSARPSKASKASSGKRKGGGSGAGSHARDQPGHGGAAAPPQPMPQQMSYGGFGSEYGQEQYAGYGAAPAGGFGEAGASHWGGGMAGGAQFEMAPPGFGEGGGVPTLAATDDGKLRELLKGMQLTRDFLRTLQQAPTLMPRTDSYLVRLNMGSRFFLYVAAQIVQISGDELQVRGVDQTQPQNVQRTKLAYVSNAVFKEDEVTELITKLRTGVIPDISLADAEAMVIAKRKVSANPQYQVARQSQQQANASANTGGGGPPPPALPPQPSVMPVLPDAAAPAPMQAFVPPAGARGGSLLPEEIQPFGQAPVYNEQQALFATAAAVAAPPPGPVDTAWAAACVSGPTAVDSSMQPVLHPTSVDGPMTNLSPFPPSENLASAAPTIPSSVLNSDGVLMMPPMG